MEYWEVVKELKEDPKKKFEAKLESKDWTVRMSVDTGFSRYFKFEVFNGARLIDQSCNGGAFNGNVALDLDWQLVRQPVTWQEAIQAWADGKTIKCEHGQITFVYNHDDEFFGNHSGVHKRLFTKGTWYVED